MTVENSQNVVTVNYILKELKKKVTDSNAKLLLHTAVVRSGLACSADTPLDKKDTQSLCMELIRSGGPGFQVGRAVYNTWVR